MLALGYDHYTAQGASTHLLLTVVFFQASWQVAAWLCKMLARIQSPIPQVY